MKKKYKVNVAVLITRVTLIIMVIAIITTTINVVKHKRKNTYLESSAYVDVNGVSTMISGVQNGGIYQKAVELKLNINNVKNVTLTKDGENIRFRDGMKIKKMGSYILSVEDTNGNVDTIYFDIEY